MDWNELRQEWREQAPAARLLAVEEIRALDGSLWKQVRRRDLIETVAGIAVAGIFGVGALRGMLAGEWVAAAFGLLVAVWGASLPFQLKDTGSTAISGAAAPCRKVRQIQRWVPSK